MGPKLKLLIFIYFKLINRITFRMPGNEFKPLSANLPDQPPSKKKRRTSSSSVISTSTVPCVQDLLPPPLTGNIIICWYKLIFISCKTISFHVLLKFRIIAYIIFQRKSIFRDCPEYFENFVSCPTLYCYATFVSMVILFFDLFVNYFLRDPRWNKFFFNGKWLLPRIRCIIKCIIHLC